jgi:hypothetical protein
MNSPENPWLHIYQSSMRALNITGTRLVLGASSVVYERFFIISRISHFELELINQKKECNLNVVYLHSAAGLIHPLRHKFIMYWSQTFQFQCELVYLPACHKVIGCETPNRAFG